MLVSQAPLEKWILQGLKVKTSAEIKAIFFDLDDTLLASHKVEGDFMLKAGEKVRAKYGVDSKEFAAVIRRIARDLWRDQSSYEMANLIGVLLNLKMS